MSEAPTQQRARIADVARQAGVSKAAVSFAFNYPSRLSTETAQRIRQVAAELGYRPHPVARMLSQRQTLTIGVLVPQALSVIFSNPFFGAFSEGVALAGHSLELWSKAGPTGWSLIREVVTSQDGGFEITVEPARNSRYEARYEGDELRWGSASFRRAVKVKPEVTLTTDEALKHKVAEHRAGSVAAALERVGIANAELRATSPNWAENVVRFLTHPVLSSLLVTIGMLGLIIELRSPGFGLPGAVGVGALAAFFWGHWIVQLAGWGELLLALGGIALLLAEVFLIPGFGFAGILGILALLAALVMSVVGSGATPEFFLFAAGRIVLALLVALGASFAMLRFMPRTRFGRQLILDTGLATEPEGDLRWLGKRGRASSPLRPAGIAEIGGERVDVVSDGELIEAGTEIEVIRVDGNRIVVRRGTDH